MDRQGIMSSIFVWKASIPNPSKKIIRYYSGSNWAVEDNDYSSRSFKYQHQIVIPGSDGDSVITFLANIMPQDWVGSELLEVHHVHYHLIRSDEYATLEHIGNWMRVITNKKCLEAEFTKENVQAEWNVILQWMSQPPKQHVTSPPQMALRKEHTKKLPRTPVMDSNSTVPIPSISLSALHTIDPVQVRQSFQEFYAKYGGHSITHSADAKRRPNATGHRPLRSRPSIDVDYGV